MYRVVALFALFVCCAATAAAQTEGKISVGGTVTWVKPTDSEVQSLVGYGALVRLNPKKGWGIAAGLSWFRADLDNPVGGDDDFARIRIWPLMGGVSYTVGEQPVLISFSIVAGPSFNDLDFRDAFLDRLPPGPRPELGIENSFAVRPGVGLTWTLAPRFAIIGFAGYSFNRPDVIYRDQNGQEFRNRWRADAFFLSTGAVFSLF
jgi:Outer membrane protein beta-barrel domain